MSVFSLFVSPIGVVYPDYVDNYTDARTLIDFFGSESEKYNVLWKRVQSLSMDDGDTKTITFSPSTLADWKVLFLRCVGECTLNIAAKDTNGSSDITSKLSCYGNRIYPGILMISTYNLVSLTVECHQDETTAELFAAVACESTDPRLITNA